MKNRVGFTGVRTFVGLTGVLGCLVCASPAFAAVAPVREEDEVVVTATRIGNHEYELTGDVTVIGANQIESSGARTVTEVLQQVPGVYVYDRSTSKTAVVDIRGFGDAATSSVLVLVNGRKLNSVDLSGPDFIQIPVGAIERIEILRGAGSVLYGDNAVAGVINIITKTGKGDPRWEITNEAGSYGRYQGAGQVSGQTGDLRYYAYGDYNDEKGYRDNSDVLARDFNTRLRYDLGDRVGLDLEVGGHSDETEIPGGLDELELLRLGRRGAADNDRSETKDVFVRVGGDVALGDEAGEWGHFLTDFTYKNRDVSDSFFRTFNSDREIDQWGVLSKYVFDSRLFGRDVDFVIGVDAYGTDNDIFGNGTNTDDITIQKDEIGAYTFAELQAIGGLYVNAGGRYQQADYAFDNRGSRTQTEREVDEWTGLAGAKYVLAPGSNVFASVQKTFRFLATDEWYSTFGGLNTNLDQQKGMQYEVGVRHAFGKLANVSVVPYWIDQEDEIYFDPVTFNNDNYDRTRRRGVESSITFDVLQAVPLADVQRFDLGFGHTYQEALFRGGLNDDNLIPLVPGHQFTHRVTVRAWEHFLFSVQGRLAGERVIGNDLDNSKSKSGAYYVTDAKFSYTLENYELFVELNNIFDTIYNTYEIEKNAFGAPAVTRDAFPAAERNFNVGVKVRF